MNPLVVTPHFFLPLAPGITNLLPVIMYMPILDIHINGIIQYLIDLLLWGWKKRFEPLLGPTGPFHRWEKRRPRDWNRLAQLQLDPSGFILTPGHVLLKKFFKRILTFTGRCGRHYCDILTDGMCFQWYILSVFLPIWRPEVKVSKGMSCHSRTLLDGRRTTARVS